MVFQVVGSFADDGIHVELRAQSSHAHEHTHPGHAIKYTFFPSYSLERKLHRELRRAAEWERERKRVKDFKISLNFLFPVRFSLDIFSLARSFSSLASIYAWKWIFNY